MEWIIGISSFIFGFYLCLYLLKNTIPNDCITTEEHNCEMGFKNRRIKKLEANQKPSMLSDEKWNDGIFPKD